VANIAFIICKLHIPLSGRGFESHSYRTKQGSVHASFLRPRALLRRNVPINFQCSTAEESSVLTTVLSAVLFGGQSRQLAVRRMQKIALELHLSTELLMRWSRVQPPPGLSNY